MKVSIVMPVYNASLYLAEALESVIHQTYTNLEIICVDDGSTDESLRILEQYQKKDKRIVIIKQKNQYAGTARNVGLAKASGEYIMFLDADDVFKKNMISSLVRRAKKFKADIIIFGYWEFAESIRNRKAVRNNFKNNTLVSALDIKESIFQKCRTMPWDKFIRLDFVRETGLQYKQTRVNNDIFFNQMIVSEARRILFCTKRFVYYRNKNSNSLQGTLNKNPTEFINAFIDVKTELEVRNVFPYFKHSFNNRIANDSIVHLQKILTYQEYKSVSEQLSLSGLIDDSEEFQNHKYSKVYDFIMQQNTNESLASLLNLTMNNMINKNSAAYRIGNYLLKIFHIS